MKTGLSYLRENMQKLPLDVREAIVNTDYLSALEQIQESEKLHIDQAAVMEEFTFKLMLGEIDGNEYAEGLQKALNIDPSQAEKIVTAVDEKVMKPILEELERIQDENLLTEDLEASRKNPESLSADDILAAVENPTPSVGVEHEVVRPVTSIVPPVVVETPVVEEKVAAPAAAVPVGWPATNAKPAPQIATMLNQKLEQPSVTKTAEIKHSIDPYKEPVE